MTWLITGGAGYIGAHVVRELRRAGREVAVLDDLSTGDIVRLPDDVPLYRGSVLDTNLLASVLLAHRATGVVHLAGHKAVADSVAHPLDYYQHNVLGMHSLLSALVRADVPRVVFSSTAAVYGITSEGIANERSRTQPLSPYGRSKLMCEYMLRDAATAYGLAWVSLRYFNVGGAAYPSLADHGADNLIPRAFNAVDSGRPLPVFGLGYPTPDGTCVRDYVHVLDLADAHATVVRRLEESMPREVYNVGRGEGASVLEVIRAVERATGSPCPCQPAPPRPGDPATVVADTAKIETELRWHARYALDDIVGSAWRAWSVHAAAPLPGGP
ncbi:MAG TPA: UDP-glucose 4-epimerase GalE [Amycolatopsis sp.]|uniref:UDP-glucose 4-epimerase GalE n=1 Tax=Amycolatopsis sp. TaxID=37632 RepID=UPI002B47C22E|nr:UDP-glucose 4-epimerase GalE [Amycolatopsis sp.]HKS45676.1 UDP-glucose 4-epimerase GalE [Amycolatopsis sp.]